MKNWGLHDTRPADSTPRAYSSRVPHAVSFLGTLTLPDPTLMSTELGGSCDGETYFENHLSLFVTNTCSVLGCRENLKIFC